MGKLIGLTAITVSTFFLMGGNAENNIELFGAVFVWVGGALYLTGKTDDNI